MVRGFLQRIRPDGWGAVVGSVAGQLAGKAMGVVEGFSLRNAFASGLTAGATAGMGGYLQGVEWAQAAGNADKLGMVGKMAMAAASVGTNWAANQLAGNNSVAFSWRNVVTSAATAGAMHGLSQTGFGEALDGFAQEHELVGGTMQGVVGAAMGYGVGKTLYNTGGWNLKQVARDAFGNAIGNSIVGHYVKKDLALTQYMG